MIRQRSFGPAQRLWWALVLALALFATGAAGAAAADARVVVIQPADLLAWHYEPATLTVAVGSTVTWVNQGSTAVTVTSADGLFDSEQIPPGGSFSATFQTPGTYRYFCVPYPHMKGTVIVTR